MSTPKAPAKKTKQSAPQKSTVKSTVTKAASKAPAKKAVKKVAQKKEDAGLPLSVVIVVVSKHKRHAFMQMTILLRFLNLGS